MQNKVPILTICILALFCGPTGLAKRNHALSPQDIYGVYRMIKDCNVGSAPKAFDLAPSGSQDASIRFTPLTADGVYLDENFAPFVFSEINHHKRYDRKGRQRPNFSSLKRNELFGRSRDRDFIMISETTDSLTLKFKKDTVVLKRTMIHTSSYPLQVIVDRTRKCVYRRKTDQT